MARPVINAEKLQMLLNNPAESRELLRIHLKTPKKVDFFYKDLVNFTRQGHLKFSPTVSWWAMGFGYMYFLYRKLYPMAGIIFLTGGISSFLAGILFQIIGVKLLMQRQALQFVAFTSLTYTFIGLLPPLMVAGVTARYTYIKKFLQDLQTAGYGELEPAKVKEYMDKMGGYHQWVVWIILAGLGTSILLFIFLLALFISTGAYKYYYG